MAQDKFDRLLDALPRIAEAVNAFSSREVQESAFQALANALGVTEVPSPNFTEPEPHSESDEPVDAPSRDRSRNGDKPQNGVANARKPRKPATKKAVSAVKGLDFRPEGKQSFKDFVTEKKPTTINERNLVAVYYLEHILGLSGIDPGQVLAAYKECSWREPFEMTQSLRDTASRKNWLNTGNSADLKTTPSGRNTVQHDMPVPKKAR